MMADRKAVVAAFAILFAGFNVSAQSTGGTTTSAEQVSPAAEAANESPLVKAAREAAAKRGTKSRVSISDKDVKKSAGKLIQTTSKPLPPVPSAVAEIDRKRLIENAAAQVAEREKKAAAGRVDALTKQVESLEQELRRIEETYYDEDDPDFREDVIEKRFEDTRAKLDGARQELDAARAAAGSSGTTTP